MSRDDEKTKANKIYYLNKVLHSVEWYHEIALPEIMFIEHPVGSVLGRAKYGNFLFVYHGVTIGADWRNDVLKRPELNDYLLMYADSAIIGHCHVGKYVILSAGTKVINESIPDYCLVCGTSPNLKIIKRTPEQMQMQFARIFREQVVNLE